MYYPLLVLHVSGHEPPYVYLASHEDDFGTVTLTRIYENRADGIFTARLTHVENSSKVVITEGKFENMEIIK